MKDHKFEPIGEPDSGILKVNIGGCLTSGRLSGSSELPKPGAPIFIPGCDVTPTPGLTGVGWGGGTLL
jgi:hypothetical protein